MRYFAVIWLSAALLAACSDDGDPGAPLTLADGAAPADAGGEQGASAPGCGNGVLEQGEACDGVNLGGVTCADLGFAGGTLACTAACQHDPSGCQAPADGRQFGERCGGSWGSCGAGLLCVQFNESGSEEGYCTAECSETSPCPGSPAGAQCVFQLVSSGKTICGFLCDAVNPTCPAGLSCTYSQDGGYHYCSTDPPPQCGNNVVEMGEECDGTDLGNMSCKGFGYASGTLGCDAQCRYDKDACTGPSSCANLPPRDCTGGDAFCSKLVLFSPTQDTGYAVTHGNSYSYLRQDTMMLIKYAAASVACMVPGSFPIGLGDMSMSNGGTPADAAGNLRHPQGTHVNGLDIDVAYYQVGQPNNNLRAVCPHTQNNQEQYHCVGPPTILDAKRSALFLAKVFESSRVRVVGVDGQIGPVLVAEAKSLHSQGMISTDALNAFASKLAYETSDTGAGWYLFHHHHFHLSTWSSSYGTPSTPPAPPPFAPELAPEQMQPMVQPAALMAPRPVRLARPVHGP